MFVSLPHYDKITTNPIYFHTSPTLTMARDRKSTRLNSSHSQISYAVFCLKKKNKCNQHILHCKAFLLYNLISISCTHLGYSTWYGCDRQCQGIQNDMRYAGSAARLIAPTR